MNVESSDVLLQVDDLHTHLQTKWGVVRAVDGVSLILRRSEVLGIVGESGSGKSMTALSILGLLPQPAGRIVQGSIRLDGEELVTKSQEEMRAIRGNRISMILQDPLTSLNPVFTIGAQIAEVFRFGRHDNKSNSVKRAIAALRDVQVAAPERRFSNYPHEMSGGMKQRVVGAISMASEPDILIADEPTTSLDVTIQAQYLRLLQSLIERTGVSIIFITHDLGIVAKMCDRVAVMYAGRIVETGPVREIFDNPLHPYTKALLKSVPSAKRKVDHLFSIEGQPPTLWNLPVGCRFAERCPQAMPRCTESYPPERRVADNSESHRASCWLIEGEDA